MKTLLTIFKKELRRFFTDHRMLISIFLPGILIFTIYSIMGDKMNTNFVSTPTEYVVYVMNEPEDFDLFLVNGWTITKNPETLTDEEILSKIKNGEVDLYVAYPENFIENSLDPTLVPQVSIYYNSALDASAAIYQYVITALDTFETNISNCFDINADINTVYDQASEDDISKKIISMMLPFILIVFLFSGAMSICSESIAGEKERGTIATLLVTPVNRSYIALGKICGLSVVSLTSAVVSFFGLIFSIPKLTGMGFKLDMYSPVTMVALFCVIIVTVLLFTTMLTIISTYAKSVKEASTLCIPVMLLVMMLGMSGMFGGNVSSSFLMYAIPIYNSIQCVANILNQSIDIPAMLLTIASNAVVISLGIYTLKKMFDSESIMFNK